MDKCSLPPPQEVVIMQEKCMCEERKIATEVDGRFVYQYCSVCNEVIAVAYLPPKEEDDNYVGI